jgi:hypothetical protein
MKHLRSFVLLLIAALIGTALMIPPARPTQAAPSAWQPVGTGIEYQEFVVTGSMLNHVYVTRMWINNPETTLETSLAQGLVSGAFETVSGMAARYDQALNNWGDPVIPHGAEGWGTRNQVVAAINGDLHDQNGVPAQGVVHSGWYAKRFANNQNRSGFGWNLDRQPFIGECVKHPQNKQVVIFPNASEHEFAGINIVRGGGTNIYIYTPQYGPATPAIATKTEVVVEMQRPNLIISGTNGAKGTVEEVRKNKDGGTPIPFDHIVLAGDGGGGDALGALQVGDVITISQEIKNYPATCANPADNSIDWTKAYAGIGGSYYYLKNGVIKDFSNDAGAMIRNPRTAIAYNFDYVFFIVVDGDNPYFSVGMNIPELADFTLNVLGATYATDMDGGWSSTMVVNGQVVNFPKNSSGVVPQAYLPITWTKPGTSGPEIAALQPTIQVNPAPLALDPGRAQVKPEKEVANGMMMTVVLPKQVSQTFSIGNQVATSGLGGVEVRLGPGTNYAVLSTIPGGTVGTIIPHIHQLNGVLAKGEYWWKVDFGAVIGWVKEASLVIYP